MMTRAQFLVCFLLAATFMPAQDLPRVEVFGGYSYLNADFNKNDTGIPRQSFNGWEASVSVNANRWLAAEGGVSGYYKTIDVGSLFNIGPIGVDVSASDYAFAGGPRLNFRPGFVHALLGVNHIKGSALGISDSQNAFAAALGGGVQYMVSHNWGVRVSADYVLTRHNFFGPDRVNQNHIRATAGIVFAFGQPRQVVPSDRAAVPTENPPAQVPQLGVAAVQDSHGVRVVAVAPNGPAAQAGIVERDYIVSVDTYNIHTIGELNAALSGKSAVKLGTQINGIWPKERDVKLK